MSVSTDIIEQTRPRAISLRWIINAREDLIWFVGSVAASYLLLILYVIGALPLIPMVAGWAILIDEDSLGVKLRAGGALEDVAPTMLGLLGIEQPSEMTGRDLRK